MTVSNLQFEIEEYLINNSKKVKINSQDIKEGDLSIHHFRLNDFLWC